MPKIVPDSVPTTDISTGNSTAQYLLGFVTIHMTVETQQHGFQVPSAPVSCSTGGFTRRIRTDCRCLRPCWPSDGRYHGPRSFDPDIRTTHLASLVPEKHTFQYPSCGLWLQASGNSDVNKPGDLRCCQNVVHEEMLPGLIGKH